MCQVLSLHFRKMITVIALTVAAGITMMIRSSTMAPWLSRESWGGAFHQRRKLGWVNLLFVMNCVLWWLQFDSSESFDICYEVFFTVFPVQMVQKVSQVQNGWRLWDEDPHRNMWSRPLMFALWATLRKGTVPWWTRDFLCIATWPLPVSCLSGQITQQRQWTFPMPQVLSEIYKQKQHQVPLLQPLWVKAQVWTASRWYFQHCWCIPAA